MSVDAGMELMPDPLGTLVEVGAGAAVVVGAGAAPGWLKTTLISMRAKAQDVTTDH